MTGLTWDNAVMQIGRFSPYLQIILERITNMKKLLNFGAKTLCKINSFIIDMKYAENMRITPKMSLCSNILVMGIMLIFGSQVAFADYAQEMANLTDKLVAIICNTFAVVGAVLTAYSIGQLVMAMKNDDADSKTKASTQLTVGIILLSMKAIISSLNLSGMIKNAWQ